MLFLAAIYFNSITRHGETLIRHVSQLVFIILFLGVLCFGVLYAFVTAVVLPTRYLFVRVVTRGIGTANVSTLIVLTLFFAQLAIWFLSWIVAALIARATGMD